MTNMKNKILATDGNWYSREECRYINNNYYKIGDVNVKDSGGCYYIADQDKYYRADTGFIFWDNEINRYVHKSANLLFGIVGKDKEEGYFSPNPVKNCKINFSTRGGNEINCIDDEVALVNNAVQNVDDGVWYSVNDPRFMSMIKDLRNIGRGRRGSYGIEFTYSVASNPDKDRILNAYNNFEKEVTSNAIRLFNLLRPFTFGFEAETSGGKVPENYLFQNKVLPLRDGSIAAYEYTSLPYVDEKDMQSFINFFNLLKKFTIIDEQCSLHFHIGNFVKQTGNLTQEDKINIVALYMLYYQLQKEIWDIIPPYKKRPEFIIKKQKDHCKDLVSLGLFSNMIYRDNNLNEEQLDKESLKVFRLFNDGYAADAKHNLKTRRHIRHGANKWEFESRYHNLNFFNVFFGADNARTIEFRAFASTTNIDKALPQLLLSVGLLKFAKLHSKEIIEANTKYKLKDICNGFKDNFGEGYTEVLTEEYLNFVGNFLLSFVNSRKETFIENYFTQNDRNDLSIKFDNEFSFNIDGVNLINYV